MATATPQLVSDPAAVVALFVVGGLLLILMCVAATLFVVYRKEFPINGRGVPEALAMLLSCAFIALGLLTGRFLPCVVLAIPYALGCHSALLIWLVRIWRLLFRFQLHQALYTVGLLHQQPESRQKRASIEREVGSWYVRNRSLGNWPFIKKIVALIVLVDLAVMSLVAYPSVFSAAPCPVAVGLLFWNVNFAIILFYTVCGVVASVLIRGFSSDAYKIKAELVRVGGGTLGLMVIYILIKQFGPVHLLLHEFLLLLILYNLTFWSTVWPVLLVRERKRTALQSPVAWDKPTSRRSPPTQGATRQKRESRRTSGTSELLRPKDQTSEFVRFLNAEGGLEAFLGFLRKEFATENMLFLMDVQQFRRNIEEINAEDEENLNAVGPAIKTELVGLFETYCVDKINISAPARNSLLRLVARVDTMYLDEFRHAFDRAYSEIFKLLRQDSWQRYRRSADFDVFKNNQATPSAPRSGLVPEALNVRWEPEATRSRAASESLRQDSEGLGKDRDKKDRGALAAVEARTEALKKTLEEHARLAGNVAPEKALMLAELSAHGEPARFRPGTPPLCVHVHGVDTEEEE